MKVVDILKRLWYIILGDDIMSAKKRESVPLERHRINSDVEFLKAMREILDNAGIHVKRVNSKQDVENGFNVVASFPSKYK